jgi:hypothetical protein
MPREQSSFLIFLCLATPKPVSSTAASARSPARCHPASAAARAILATLSRSILAKARAAHRDASSIKSASPVARFSPASNSWTIAFIRRFLAAS